MSMKFITSTDLKQWADTNECRQLLPELIKRLIDASVSNVDILSFPSGDAVCLPGWDGVVSCEECIDMIPAGVSLWECGASEDVKGKIDSDYEKRTGKPLGFEKSESTFVFVTPRIWSGADEWRQTHQGVWKNVVVYTAVELERWIEKCPSVGMWLAEKRKLLPSGGYELPETCWNKWAQGKEYRLPYEIVLPGREEVSKQVVDACKNALSVILQALTQSEGIAFAIASILSCDDADKLKDRVIVVTEKNAYNDLVEHYDNLILLTTITEDINYSTSRGHSVIVASTPEDQLSGAIKLPIIKKEGFVNALVNIGINQAKADKIAIDTARDINVLRRRLEIECTKPKWSDSLIELLPAILVGKWNNSCDGDKEILKLFSGLEYDQYETKLCAHLLKEESPLINIGNIWRIRSPYETIEFAIASRVLSRSMLGTFRTVCLDLIQDDDPEAVERLQNDGLHFRTFSQKYSNTIKKGVFQTLCLLSVLDKSENREFAQWVDETVSLMLKNWSLTRYLSNLPFLTTLAEASPDSFLNFVENLPNELLDEIFKPRKGSFLSEWEINYTELLWSLEMLAWDENYFNRVTLFLLRFSKYKNESNYGNRPINSLLNIFRFYQPQTYVSFEDRMTVLSSLILSNKEVLFDLCKRVCESIFPMGLMLNSHFKWRLFGNLKFSLTEKMVTVEELNVVVDLMLRCCGYSAENISDLISLSSNSYMSCCRSLMIDRIREHIDDLRGNQIVVDALRNDITHHKQCEGARWALTEEELIPYQDLMNELEPKDVLHKHAWLFEDWCVQLPYNRRQYDTRKLHELQDELRLNSLKEVVEERGEEALWDFVQLVKCPESMSKSIVAIFDDKLNEEIFRKYKTKEISESFVSSYLYALCHKDVLKYQTWAEQIISESQDMVVVLYAPGYIKALADIAEKTSEVVKNSYWQTINIGCWTKEDADRIVRGLISANRYSDALEIVAYDRNMIHLSDVDVAQVMLDYLTNDSVKSRPNDIYSITTILEDLDNSEDPNVIRPLIFVEFILYRSLEHQMDVSKLRFTKELSRNPELMIQLVELASLPDGKEVTQAEISTVINRRPLVESAYHILFFSRNIVSFNNEEGVFDGEFMKCYVEQLYRLAKERNRSEVIDMVVGDILGDIPRDDNYPPQALCELVEKLGNDVVDQHIRLRIYNSRGITRRAYDEGGNQERSIVSKFEKYREKTKLLYPRMKKIFDDLIKCYKNVAVNMDNEAEIMDLQY